MFVKRNIKPKRNNTLGSIFDVVSRLKQEDETVTPEPLVESEPTTSATLPFLEFVHVVYPDFFYNWGNLGPEHLLWLNQKHQAYKAAEPERIEAQKLMALAGDEALEMNLTITALLRARDKYKEAATGLVSADAKALASKLASVCQELASAVKKAGR